MIDRKKELVVNTLIIGIGNHFTKAISFLLVPFFTIWLTTKEYGDYDLLFSYVSLFVPFLSMQLEQAVLRFTLEDKNKGTVYFKTGFTYLLITSILFIPLALFAIKFEYQLPFVFCTVTYAWQVYSIEYLRGLNELRKYSIANIFCGLCTIFLSFFMLSILNRGVGGLLTAFGLSYLLTSIYIFFSTKLYIDLSIKIFDISVFKKLIYYSFPLLPNAISWWITSVSDRTIINIFLGSSFNGIYAVSTKIPTLITVFYSIFNLAWQQSAIVSSSDKYEIRKEFYNATYEKLFSFLFTSSLVVVTITPFLYRYLLGYDYISGIYIVPTLILSTLFLNLSQYQGGILLGQKDTKTNGVTTVIAAVLNLIINFLLISQIGLYAAAFSTLFSYIILFYLRLNKLKGLFEKKKILTQMAQASILLYIISFLSINLGYLWLQIILLASAGLYFIYINKHMFKTVVNKIRRK